MFNKMEREVYSLIWKLPAGNPDKDTHLAKLDRIRSACGCSLGATFFISTFTLYPVFCWFFTKHPPLLSFLWKWIVYSVAMAIVGKITGLLLSRLELLYMHRILKQKIHSDELQGS